MIENLKWYFEGVCLYELQTFLHKNENYNKIFSEKLECTEKLLVEKICNNCLQVNLLKILNLCYNIYNRWNFFI